MSTTAGTTVVAATKCSDALGNAMGGMDASERPNAFCTACRSITKEGVGRSCRKTSAAVVTEEDDDSNNNKNDQFPQLSNFRSTRRFIITEMPTVAVHSPKCALHRYQLAATTTTTVSL